MPGKVILAAVLISVVLLISCQYNPYTIDFTKVQPSDAELVGDYTATSETVHLVKEKGEYEVESFGLTVEPDGGIVFDNVPDWFLHMGLSPPQRHFLNTRGTWKVRPCQAWWCVHTVIPRGDPPRDFGFYLHVIGDEPPHILHITVGDPDAGMAMQFEKRPDSRR